MLRKAPFRLCVPEFSFLSAGGGSGRKTSEVGPQKGYGMYFCVLFPCGASPAVSEGSEYRTVPGCLPSGFFREETGGN